MRPHQREAQRESPVINKYQFTTKYPDISQKILSSQRHERHMQEIEKQGGSI